MAQRQRRSHRLIEWKRSMRGPLAGNFRRALVFFVKERRLFTHFCGYPARPLCRRSTAGVNHPWPCRRVEVVAADKSVVHEEKEKLDS